MTAKDTGRGKSLKDLMREGRVIRGVMTPAGFEVSLRLPNIESHALSGGLPAAIKKVATEGVSGVDKAIQAATADGDAEMLTYLEGIIARMFVEPEFEPPVWELRPVDPDKPQGEQKVTLVEGDKLDEYLTPPDYRWAILVAFGEKDVDGLGRRLWGREPLSRFKTFREEHDCPEDCPRCSTVVARLSLGGDDD